MRQTLLLRWTSVNETLFNSSVPAVSNTLNILIVADSFKWTYIYECQFFTVYKNDKCYMMLKTNFEGIILKNSEN